ncbi:hypothetical protein KEA01_05280, partial [Treponema pallidum]
ALLTLGYRWFSAGGYFASQASNVFQGVFLTNAMTAHDCAAYIKLETKGSDPDTSFLEGLDLGVDVRFLARNIAMREHDCAAYIKLETKGSDPDTSFLEGLDLGVDVRTHIH